MIIKRCEICDKKIEVSNWLSTIELNVWGTLNGEVNDNVSMEAKEICYNCYFLFDLLLSWCKKDKNKLKEIMGLIRKGNK